MRALAIAVLAAGCVTSNSEVCGFGICPDGTRCDTTHSLCVTPDQLTACDGKSADDACTAGTIDGHCLDNVCLPSVCGDAITEFGEMCDDGNTNGDDSCSADCTSDRTCGNGVIDVTKGEQCDDHNLLDHDGCSSGCLTETPHWIEHSLVPPKREGPGYAYDARRDRTVMFGGFDFNGGGAFNDTWEWNGGEWIRIPTASAPAARVGPGMVYDEARRRTMLFGGSDGGSYLGDTWLWDGQRWTALDVDGPSGRLSPAMAYDAKRQRTVLFGGISGSSFFADTWEWNGVAWSQLSPAHHPTARSGAEAAYDPLHGVIVLVGGTDRITYFPETWIFDGTDWTNVTPAGAVPQAANGGMVWDPTTQRIVQFGGRVNVTLQSTLWAWNGSTWTTIGAAGPSARNAPLFAGGAAQSVLFGGSPSSGANNETWVLANNTWTQWTLAAKDPGPRAAFAMGTDPLRARSLVYGGETAVGVFNGDSWDLGPTGYTLRASAPPLARTLPCMTYDVAHHELVMFGGKVGAAATAETWTWTGAGWTQHTPAMSPPPRFEAACAFDGVHVTLFGGTNEGGALLGDAWSWDGTTWAPAAVPAALKSRYGAAAGYDPIRKQLVLFGGHGSSALFFNDTWTYDGTTWATQTMTGFQPPGRWDATMTTNPARQAVVLVGGQGGDAAGLDAYEWDGSRWHVVPAENSPPNRYQHGAATSLDGGGVMIYGGLLIFSTTPAADRWELRYDAPDGNERCAAADADGDGKSGCLDPDCWTVCTPECPPGTSCPAGGPRCGDNVCDPNRETCRTCPADCMCAPVCGDFVCDPGETCPGDCP